MFVSLYSGPSCNMTPQSTKSCTIVYLAASGKTVIMSFGTALNLSRIGFLTVSRFLHLSRKCVTNVDTGDSTDVSCFYSHVGPSGIHV